MFVRLPLKSRSQFRVGLDTRNLPVLDDGVDVLRRPPDEERDLSTSQDVVDRGEGEILEGRQGHRIIGVEEIDQMMRHTTAFLERRLCRPDIHSPIEQARVGVHDLAIHLLREVDREARLADRRRADDDDERRTFFGWRNGSVGRHRSDNVE